MKKIHLILLVIVVNWLFGQILDTPEVSYPIIHVDGFDAYCTLKWTTVQYATEYEVEGDIGGNFIHEIIDGSDSDELILSNVKPGFPNWYRVKANGYFGDSDWSEGVSFKILIRYPESLPGSDITSNSFTANWVDFNGADGYRIDVDDNIDFSSPLESYNDLDVDNVTSIEVTGLLPNTTYYYRLRAYQSGLITENSNVITTNTYRFEKIDLYLPHDSDAESVWGDYDNDGDLDFVLQGNYYSEIFRNDNGEFININAHLETCSYPSYSWSDYDNDGDLDILYTGSYSTILYRNDNGNFIETDTDLMNVTSGSSAWGDFDNDGDPDILLAGRSSEGIFTVIYRNENGSFYNIGASLTGSRDASLEWGDYDNDGDLDILITGSAGSKIYRNDSGSFNEIDAGIIGSIEPSSSWGDYDNDGDLDIFCIDEYHQYIYRNDNGSFVKINAGLSELQYIDPSAAWGDFDNDGDLDILFSGMSTVTGQMVSFIYENESGTFSQKDVGLEIGNAINFSIADYDNDGDLDIMYEGTKLFRNEIIQPNTPPSSPLDLSSSLENNDVTLSWYKATDNETPQDGLSYNLYIGSSPQSVDINSPMSDISTGYRKVVKLGNAGQNTSWSIKDLPDGIYYWSVQAVDHAFAGSLFGGENIFVKGENTLLEDEELFVSAGCELRILEGAKLTTMVNSNIILNADARIEIDQAAELHLSPNALISCNPGSKIIVHDAGTLYSYEASILGNESWQGIIAEQSSIVTLTTTSITNAVYALDAFSADLNIFHNSIRDCENGLYVINCENYRIDDNYLYGKSLGTGISLIKSGGETYESAGELFNNTIKNFAHGMDITSCSPLLCKNTIAENINYGLYITGYNSKPTLLNTTTTTEELNNEIINNGIGTLYYQSAQIYLKYCSGLYMTGGYNNIYSGNEGSIPSVPCIRGVDPYTTSKVDLPVKVVIDGYKNYWGASEDLLIDANNFVYFFDLWDASPTTTLDGYLLRYDPYAYDPYETGSQSSVAYSTHIPPSNESTTLSNAIRLEQKGNYTASINLYEKIIDKFPETSEYYVASSRLPGVYNKAGQGLDDVLRFYDEELSSGNVDKNFFKEMKISTNILNKQYNEAIELAEQMKEDARTQEEALLSDLDIYIANMMKDSKSIKDFDKERNDLKALISALTKDNEKEGSSDIEIANMPNNTELFQNYPNPFNPSTEIKYFLLSNSNVSIKVYNSVGREVADLVNSSQDAGYHSVTFDASKLSNGVFYCRLVANGRVVDTKKMLLIK